MKTTTLELIRSVLKSDETISPDERARIIRATTTTGETLKPEPSRIVSHGEAAERMGVKVRTIYHYCRKGILKRVTPAGKKCASGVTSESLENAIRGMVS